MTDSTRDQGALLADDAQVRVATEVSRGGTFALRGWLRLAPWVAPRRKTLLITPASTSGEAVRPTRLLVLLHGCRQNAADFARAAGVHEFVAEHHWAVLLPDQSRMANMYRCWNWFDKRVMRGGGEVAIVAKATEKARRMLGIEAAQTAIAGMSSGAALAAAVCAHHPARYRLALFHSGLAYGASAKPSSAMQAISSGPQRDVSLLVKPDSGSYAAVVIHGVDDAVVNPLHADELMRQAMVQSGHLPPGSALGAPDSTVERTIDGRRTTIRRWARHRQIMIQGLDHAWVSSNANDAPFFSSKGSDTLGLLQVFFEQANATGAASVEPAI
ncbi:MAG: PHB depolymerase family esterase [Burkholderiaceae bacterium]